MAQEMFLTTTGYSACRGGPGSSPYEDGPDPRRSLLFSFDAVVGMTDALVLPSDAAIALLGLAEALLSPSDEAVSLAEALLSPSDVAVSLAAALVLPSDEALGMVQLPGDLQGMGLLSRSGPYLTLPARKPRRRMIAVLLALLPPSDKVYQDRALRGVVWRAVCRRAHSEAELLQAAGFETKAQHWRTALATAAEDKGLCKNVSCFGNYIIGRYVHCECISLHDCNCDRLIIAALSLLLGLDVFVTLYKG
jgi:hypothetical protein